MLGMRAVGRIALLAIGLLVIGMMLVVGGVVSAEGRHAGTVVSVDPVSGAMKLDELGLAAVRRTFDVKVAPNAEVVLVERVEPVRDLNQAWKNTPIRLEDVRPGDYVVVEIGDQPGTVRRVTVTLRGRAGS
jgi:hypothetical protein